QNILKEIGFNPGNDNEPIFYTNTNPKVLKTILGGNYVVQEKDF
ncbi:MAG: hypothetical protein RIR01_1120, partial [Bacteroidota bacterium]